MGPAPDGADGTPAERPAVAGLLQVEVPSRTLPPFTTTNAYVVSRGGIALVVDPGGDERAAIDAIVGAVREAGADEPKGIVLTHTHGDHVAGVGALRERWPDVTVYAHPLELGRLDPSWRPKGLAGGRRLTLGDEVVEAVHTPGHSPGHLALWLARPRALLAGDLVAGAGSIWVGLPEGDVQAYLESLARASALEPALVAPGHGPLRGDGAAVLHEARAHRLQREAAVLTALRAGPLPLPALREAVYGTLEPPAEPYAERSILAHLSKLLRERRVMHVGRDERGPYMLAPGP